jgi:hypothetical protein
VLFRWQEILKEPGFAGRENNSEKWPMYQFFENPKTTWMITNLLFPELGI